MRGVRPAGLMVVVLAWGAFGCATVPIPPSESTMSILRSYKSQLEDKVASGHLSRTQARDLYYGKLAEVQPPLPDLGALLEFRKQVDAQVEAKTLSLEQADARLTARESEMLANWEEMAARYAREQREFERLRQEQERGFRQQQLPVGGRPF